MRLETDFSLNVKGFLLFRRGHTIMGHDERKNDWLIELLLAGGKSSTCFLWPRPKELLQTLLNHIEGCYV